ncbi:spore coat protein GerQ [Oceanobacillus sp. 143]|uniref:Spore coat protein GerQ n=1 Tax=Oceanobacillus zhaokaii TaxID=2052660 RepID=A0A345PKZ0_9BACI|nr:spore coat protein GerQ [Oceanobacillus zhaokaii]AXI10670.1 spore coat protein GerQ [Oceanobacillus zhaokaii]QGS69625.1 spore coat protein GerQ [Oceanobacillus sp. 143]
MSENQESSNQNSNQIPSQQQFSSQNPYQPFPYYYYPQTSQAYYPAFPTRQFPTPSQQPSQTTGGQGQLPMQQSYIENILRLNRGKLATVHMTFEGGHQKTFRGIIEAAGRDHLILSESGTGRRVLLLMVYLDYVTFDEEINYAYPFGSGQQLTTQQPR